MSRATKFRGRDTSGKWVYGDLVIARAFRSGSQRYIVTYDEYSGDFEFTAVDNEGQFTGLLDKNEVEIYEGDVVEIAVNPYHGKYEVKFGNYILEKQHKRQIERPTLGWYLQNGFSVLSLAYACSQPKDYFASTHSVEVIGNIYESPKLIKEATHED